MELEKGKDIYDILLTERQKDIYYLRYIKRKTIECIALEIHYSSSTVKKELAKIKKIKMK